MSEARNVLTDLGHDQYEVTEDLRQLSVWAQVHAYYLGQEPPLSTTEVDSKIKAIQTKYPEASGEIALLVLACETAYAESVKGGDFLDNDGRTFLTWCLKSFDEVMP